MIYQAYLKNVMKVGKNFVLITNLDYGLKMKFPMKIFLFYYKPTRIGSLVNFQIIIGCILSIIMVVYIWTLMLN